MAKKNTSINRAVECNSPPMYEVFCQNIASRSEERHPIASTKYMKRAGLAFGYRIFDAEYEMGPMLAIYKEKVIYIKKK